MPPTYSLWLTRSGGKGGDLLASIPVKNGRADFVASYPAKRLTGWNEVRLLHQPSGNPANFSMVHPALVGKLPKKAGTI